jgi:hypothetical protein
MIVRRRPLLIHRPYFKPMGVHIPRPPPHHALHHSGTVFPHPPPSGGGAQPSSISAGGLSMTPTGPTTYQLELQEYLTRLRWFYNSRALSPGASSLSSSTAGSQQQGNHHRRRQGVPFLLSAASLFFIPYMIVDDWLDHVYAARTRKYLREARDKTTKCKVIDVKRVSAR